MKRSYWLLLVLALAVASSVLFGFRQRVAASESTPAKPQRTIATLAAAPGWVDVQGGTRRLNAKSDGVVSEITAVSDDPVAAGAVLLRLDEQALRLDEQLIALERSRGKQMVQSLSRQLTLAEDEALRLHKLVAIQAEPADVLRQANAQVQSFKSALQAAQLADEGSRLQQQRLALQLKQHVILAPRRGRVLRTDVHLGESVSVGMPVIWFAPDAPLIVRAEVDERLIAQLKIGMNATVETEAGDGRIYPAKLLSIARVVGPVRALPEVRAAAKDDHVVECILSLGEAPLLIGQRVIVRLGGAP